MTRYKTMFIFIVTVFCLAMLSEADDNCIWCNDNVSQKFMNCLNRRMMNNYMCKDLSKVLMKDMKFNLLDASKAMKLSGPTKENAMKGALTYAIAELIGKSENSDRIITEIIYIFKGCYGFINKIPDGAYLDEMKKTLPIIIRDNKYPANPQQFKNLQFPTESSETGQNSYKPQYKNVPQTPVSTSYANANGFSANKEINEWTGFSSDKQQPLQYENDPQKQAGFSDSDANSFKNIQQEQFFPQEPRASFNANDFFQNQNINRWNGYSSGKQQSFQYENNPQQQGSVSNADANIRNNIQPQEQNFLQRPRANQVSAVDSYASSYEISQKELENAQKNQFYNINNPQYSNQRNQNALPNTYQRNTLNDEQNQEYSKKPFIWNNQQNKQPYVKSFDYPQNQNPNPYSKQFSEYQYDSTKTDTDAIAYEYNAPQSNTDNRLTDADSSSSMLNSHADYELQNDYAYNFKYPVNYASSSFTNNGGDNSNQNILQKTLPKDNTKSKPNYFIPQSDGFNSQQSGPNTKDDKTANALKFSEILYSIFYDSKSFKDIFNVSTTKYQAIYITYFMCYNALISCGYSEDIAHQIAKNSINFMKTFPEGSQTYSYAEAICKMLMMQFYTKDLIKDTPVIQATNLGNAITKCLENPQILQNIYNKPGDLQVTQQEDKSKKNSENFDDRSSDKVGENTTGNRKDESKIKKYYYDDKGNNITDSADNYTFTDFDTDILYYYDDYAVTDSADKSDNNTVNDFVIDNSDTDIFDNSDDYTVTDSSENSDNYTVTDSSDIYDYDDDYDVDYDDDDDDDADSDKGEQSTTESTQDTIKSYAYDDYFDNDDGILPYKAKKLKQDKMKLKWEYVNSNNGNFRDILRTSQKPSKQPLFPKDDDQQSSKSPPRKKDYFPVKSDEQKYLSSDESSSQLHVSDSNQNPDIKTNKKVANDIESKDRVKILIRKALDCMQDKKFNYSMYNSAIAALAKEADERHPDWGAQKSVMIVLIDAVIALSQLLEKGNFKDTNGIGQQIAMPVQNKPVYQRAIDYSTTEENNVYNPLNEKTEKTESKTDYQVNQNPYPLVQQTSVSQTEPAFPNSVPDQPFSSLSQNEAQGKNVNLDNQAFKNNQNSFSQINNNNANPQQFQEQVNSDQRNWNLKKETFPVSQTVNSNAEVPNTNRMQNQFVNQPNWGYSQQSGANIPNLLQPGTLSNWEENRQRNQGLAQQGFPIKWEQNGQSNQGLVQSENSGSWPQNAQNQGLAQKGFPIIWEQNGQSNQDIVKPEILNNWGQNGQSNQGFVNPGVPNKWGQNGQNNQDLVKPEISNNWGQNSQSNQGFVNPGIPNNWVQNGQNNQDLVKPGILGNWAPLQQRDQSNSNFEQNKNWPFSQQGGMNTQNFMNSRNQGINSVNPANQDINSVNSADQYNGGIFQRNNIQQNNPPQQGIQQRWG